MNALVFGILAGIEDVEPAAVGTGFAGAVVLGVFVRAYLQDNKDRREEVRQVREDSRKQIEQERTAHSTEIDRMEKRHDEEVLDLRERIRALEDNQRRQDEHIRRQDDEIRLLKGGRNA